MMTRQLTITLKGDWKAALRQAGRQAASSTYAGEVLNFETPGAFFGQLTERRWAIVRAMQGQGAMSVRELAQRVGRDVKRVHEDAQALLELGLLERDDDGLRCPFESVHIDMELRAAA
jgi:predicted transcriptional regulator